MKRLIFAVSALSFLACATAANAVTLGYSTSGAPTQMKLGDTIGSQYDILQIQGASGTLIDGGNVLLDTLTFTAGWNALTPANYVGRYSFSETVTIGSSSAQIVIPFNLSINASDTLSIVGGSSVSLLVGSSLWTFVVNGLTIGPNFGGSQVASLYASVSDPPAATPLPAALVLFGSGLGGMVLLGRRKKAAGRGAAEASA